MMRIGDVKGKQIEMRQVNPGELTAWQKSRVDEARRRAEHLSGAAKRLIAAAGADRAGFETHARWFVARCHGGQEQRIADELTECNIQAWCPMREVRRAPRRGLGVKIYDVPVFHSYLFVRLMPDAEAWMGALSASRLSGFVGIGGIPYAMREDMIKALENSLKLSPKDANDLPVKVGQRVDVVDGPLYGLQATIRRLIPKYLRAKAEVSLFGQMTIVEFDLEQLQARV